MGVEVGAKKKSLSCLQLKDCTQFTLSLRIVDPSHVRVACTRLAPGQVFWLSDHPNCRAFPSRSNVTVANLRLSSPITAAGPLPTSTGFPIKPFRVPKLCCLLLLQGGGKKQEKKGLFHRLFFIQHRKPGHEGQSQIPPCGGRSSMTFPVKIASCFGVLEYWSVGKSESPNFNLNESFHYSITPPLHHSSRLPQVGKDH